MKPSIATTTNTKAQNSSGTTAMTPMQKPHFDAVRRGATRRDAVRRGATRCDAVRRGATRSDAVRRGATRSDAGRHV